MVLKSKRVFQSKHARNLRVFCHTVLCMLFFDAFYHGGFTCQKNTPFHASNNKMHAQLAHFLQSPLTFHLKSKQRVLLKTKCFTTENNGTLKVQFWVCQMHVLHIKIRIKKQCEPSLTLLTLRLCI